MSLFTKPITWPAWKFSVLKTSMVLFGMLVGCYFHEALASWQGALLGGFLITAAITTFWAFQSLFPSDGAAGDSSQSPAV